MDPASVSRKITQASGTYGIKNRKYRVYVDAACSPHPS